MKVGAVFQALAYPLVVLIAANMLNMQATLYASFTAMLTIVLALVVRIRHRQMRGKLPGSAAVAALIGVLSAMLVAGPAILVAHGRLCGDLPVLAVLMAAIAVADDHWAPTPQAEQATTTWSARQMALTALAGMAAFALQAMGVLTPWSPP